MYWKRSLSPTARLYELGLEGMADQYEVPEPMVTVFVAAASVAADESSAASAERARSTKRADRMRSGT